MKEDVNKTLTEDRETSKKAITKMHEECKALLKEAGDRDVQIGAKMDKMTANEIKKAGAHSEKHRENRVKQLSDHNTLGMERGGWGG